MIANLLLGEKADGAERSENRNVEPGDVVGDDQLDRLAAQRPVSTHAHPEAGARQAVKQDGRRAGRAPTKRLRDSPRRTDRRQQRRQGKNQTDDAEGGDRADRRKPGI